MLTLAWICTFLYERMHAYRTSRYMKVSCIGMCMSSFMYMPLPRL